MRLFLSRFLVACRHRQSYGKKIASEKERILQEIQGSVYIEGLCVAYVCFWLSSVLMRRDTEGHKKRRKKTRERERKKETSKQPSILYVRVPAQQREIKHRGVTKTAETLSL